MQTQTHSDTKNGTHLAGTLESTEDNAAKLRTLIAEKAKADDHATNARLRLVQAARELRPGALAVLQQIDAILGEPQTTASTPRTRKASAKAAAPATKRTGRRLQRRSVEELKGMLDRVVSHITKIGAPQGAEAIRKALGVERKELPRVLKLGLESKALKAKGEKRSREYSVAK